MAQTQLKGFNMEFFNRDKLFQRNAIEVPQTLGICCPYIVLNFFERNEYTEPFRKDEYTVKLQHFYFAANGKK